MCLYFSGWDTHYSNSRLTICVEEPDIARVHDLPKIDSPDSNTMQKQRTFISAYRGSIPSGSKDPQLNLQIQC